MSDAVHRYPGIRAFTNDPLERTLFQGRARETKSLLHLILAERLVVLSARSGIGKSSLIGAGVTHPLQARGYCPVPIRLNDPATRPVVALREQFGAEVARQGYEFQEGEPGSLWAYFKTCEIWDDDELIEPVLILDQFEELFTLHDDAERREFIRELAMVVRGIGPREEEAKHGGSPPPIRVLMSMREDFLGRLEELAHDLPAIFENRFRIEPLSRKQARQAIIKPAELEDERFVSPPFLWSPEAVGKVLDFLASGAHGGEQGSVEPFQLQLVCQHVEQQMIPTNPWSSIDWTDLGGEAGLKAVMDGFYQRTLADVGSRFGQRKVASLCEDGLITEQGRRLSLEESDIEARFGLSVAVLRELVDRRLLRREPRVGSNYYELSHDTLVEPILEARNRRRRKRSVRRTRAMVATLVAFLAVLGVGAQLALERVRIERWVLEAQRALEDQPDRGLVYAIAAAGRSQDYPLNRGDGPSMAAQQTLATAVSQARVSSRLDLSRPPVRGASAAGCPEPAAAGWSAPFPAAVAPSPIDRLVAVGGADGRTWLVDFAGVAQTCTAEPHPTGVRAVAWSPRGHRFATVDLAGEVRVWGLDGSAVGDPLPQDEALVVDAVALDPIGQFVAVGTREGLIRLGSVSVGRWVSSRPSHLPVLRDVPTFLRLAFAEGRRLLSVGADGQVLSHLLERGRLETTPLRPEGGADGTLALSRSGDVAAWLGDGELHVASASTGRSGTRATPGATLVTVDPAGSWIAYGNGREVTVVEREAFLHGRTGPGTEMRLTLGVVGCDQLLLTSDGERLITVSLEGGLTSWDLLYARRGEQPTESRGPADITRAGAVLSADGRRVAAIAGSSVVIWSTQGAGEPVFIPLDEAPETLALSDQMVAVGWRDRIAVYHRSSPIWEDRRPGSVSAMRFRDDGMELAVAWRGGPIERRVAANGQVTHTILDEFVDPAVLQYSGTLKRFVVGEAGGRVLALPDPSTWVSGRDHAPYVSLVHVRAPGAASATWAAGDAVIASPRDGVVAVVADGSKRRELEPPGAGSPTAIVAGTRAGTIALARENASITVWDGQGRRTAPMRGLGSTPSALGIADAGHAAVAYSADGGLVVFDLLPAARGGRSDPAVPFVAQILPSDPAGHALVSTDGDAHVHLWDGVGGGLRGVVRACVGSSVRAAAGSPDGAFVAVGCEDGRVEFRDALLEPIGAPPTVVRDGSVEALAWTGEGTLAVGDSAGQVHTYVDRVRSGTPWTVSSGSPIKRFATAPGGRIAAVAEDGTVQVKLTPTSSAQLIEGLQGGVNAIAFSGDGAVLIAAGEGRLVRLWDLSEGAAPALRPTVARTPMGGVVSVGAAAGDDVLFASDNEGRVHVWRFADAELIYQSDLLGTSAHAWPRTDGTIATAAGDLVGGVHEGTWRGLLTRACDRLRDHGELRAPEAGDSVAERASATCEQASGGAGADPEAGDSGQTNPLMAAAARGRHAEVLAALKAGASPLDRDGVGDTALHLAAGAGHSEIVEDLLAHGGDSSVANDLGVTPLMRAAWAGDLESARALLDAASGVAVADLVRATDHVGGSALMRAGMTGQIELVEYLHRQGAWPGRPNAAGLRAADLARIRGQGLDNVFFELDKVPPTPPPSAYGLDASRLWADLDRIVPARIPGQDAEAVRAWMVADGPDGAAGAFDQQLRTRAAGGEGFFEALLGLAYWHGWAVEADPEIAINHLRNAATREDSLGQTAAGMAWWEALGDPTGEGTARYRDLSWAWDLLSKASEAGDMRARAVVGIVRYNGGLGQRADRVRGCRDLFEAKSAGDPLATSWLAQARTEGRCGARSEGAALEDWKRVSAGDGWTYPPADVAQAEFCLASGSEHEGCAEPVESLRRALAVGDPRAPCGLARVHLFGLAGRAVEMDKALEMLERCVDGGDPWAATTLGWLVETERIAPSDASACVPEGAQGLEALRCYRLGSAVGYAPAIHRLTSRYRLP